MHEVPRDVLLVGGQNKKGVFCAEGLEKGTCQNKIGGVLC